MPDFDTTQLILTELRQLRTDFSEFALRVEGRLSSLEADNHAVMGHIQPGRMAAAEAEIRDLQRWRWRMVGISTGCSVVISSAFSLIALFLRR